LVLRIIEIRYFVKSRRCALTLQMPRDGLLLLFQF
jgi:hypothetical protein